MNYNTQTSNLIEAYLTDHTPTICKPHYGRGVSNSMAEHTHNIADNTKDTYGSPMATQMTPQLNEDGSPRLSEDGGQLWASNGWCTNMDIATNRLLRKAYTFTPEFITRLDRFKHLLKRKARLSANKNKRVSKTGKTTKYIKRSAPTPPSQQA